MDMPNLHTGQPTYLPLLRRLRRWTTNADNNPNPIRTRTRTRMGTRATTPTGTETGSSSRSRTWMWTQTTHRRKTRKGQPQPSKSQHQPQSGRPQTSASNTRYHGQGRFQEPNASRAIPRCAGTGRSETASWVGLPLMRNVHGDGVVDLFQLWGYEAGFLTLFLFLDGFHGFDRSWSISFVLGGAFGLCIMSNEVSSVFSRFNSACILYPVIDTTWLRNDNIKLCSQWSK